MPLVISLRPASNATLFGWIIGLILLSGTIMLNHVTASHNQDMEYISSRGMTLSRFTGLLKTETENDAASFVFVIEDEDRIAQHGDKSNSRDSLDEGVWKSFTDHEWERAFQSMTRPSIAGYTNTTTLRILDTMEGSVPFILCSSEEHKLGGYGRWKQIQRRIADYENTNELDKTYIIDTNPPNVVYNKEDMLCVIIPLPALLASNLALNSTQYISIQPLPSMGKIIKGSFQSFSNRVDDLKTMRRSHDANERLNNLPQWFPRINVLLCSDLLEKHPLGSEEQKIFSKNMHVALRLNDKLHQQQTSLSEEYIWHSHAHHTTVSSSHRAEWLSNVFQKGAGSQDCVDLLSNLIFTLNPELRIFSVILQSDVRSSLVQNIKECGYSLLIALSLLDDICSVEVEPKITLMNAQASWMVQSGIRNTTSWHDEGLTGKGEIIAISDTGVDVDNCYFHDANGAVKHNGEIDTSMRKVVQYVPYVDTSDAIYGHGTHVCGTAVGHRSVDGVEESDGMANGIAKDAKLALFDIGGSDGQIVLPLVTAAYLITGRKAGSHLHSASWGTDYNEYGLYANAFDRYHWLNDDFLAIVAAGNTGDSNSFHTVGDPSTAKNVVGVGAGHSSHPDLMTGQLGESYVSSFSSKGPTADGRTKPDVIAPGYSLLSSASRPDKPGACDPASYPEPGQRDDGVLSLFGTSMATPVVTGSAALIRQYFLDGFYPTGQRNLKDSFDPSGNLIKAILLNGGQAMNGVDNDMGSVYPSAPYDAIQNYGRISLIDSLYIHGKSNIQARVFDRQSIFSNKQKIELFTIDTSKGCGGKEFSAMLTWTDFPGLPGCQSCLYDDLDLFVTKNSNHIQRYYPNGRDDPDTIHNNERIRIPASHGDTFEVTVDASNIVNNPHSYSLVVTGCFGGVANELNTNENVFLNDHPKQAKDNKTLIFAGVFVGLAIIAATGYFGKQLRDTRSRPVIMPEERYQMHIENIVANPSVSELTEAAFGNPVHSTLDKPLIDDS